MCLIPVQFSKISAPLLPKSAVLIYQVSISMSMFFITFFKNFFHACIEKAACFQTASFHAGIRNQSYVLTSYVQLKQEQILHYLHAHLRCFRESHQAICLQLPLRVL